ncbi:hypothetical protein N7499_013201 [Penicillium canescens]|nr:hypothetical protein N7522_002183 [Penicillium canescens]KAJ6064521.1 hypothetical protein N7499_013201 [Penicillium canescens]KAJ6153981.1 hypothetical protein N7485_012350 [Penicillium canescens]
MSLQSLPTEIILCIVDNLSLMRDINALVRTHPRLREQLELKLYKLDAKAHGGAAALWAAEKGRLSTLRKSVAADAKIPKSDRFNTHVKTSDFIESLSIIPRYPRAHPITAAAAAGSKACIRFLIRYGVYPNFLDDHFTTPIQAAAARGHTGVVKMLLAGHPEVFRGAFTLRRSLKVAALFGFLPVLEVLFAHLESPNSGGDLPVCLAAQIILYEALWHNQPDVVVYALSKGANVNVIDSEATLWFVADIAPWEPVSRVRRILRQEHKAKKVILGQEVCGWREYHPDIMDAALTGRHCDLVRLVIDAGFEGPNGRQSYDSISLTIARAHWRRLQNLIDVGDRPHLWPNGNWTSNRW